MKAKGVRSRTMQIDGVASALWPDPCALNMPGRLITLLLEAMPAKTSSSTTRIGGGSWACRRGSTYSAQTSPPHAQPTHEIVSVSDRAGLSAKRCEAPWRRDIHEAATSAFSGAPVKREYRVNGQALVSPILSSSEGLLHTLHDLGMAWRTPPQFAHRCDEGASGTFFLDHDKSHRSQGVAPTEHRGAPTLPSRDAPAVAHS